MINTSVKKKKNINNFLLHSLFKSKSFYGESLNKTNKNILPFIYGIRHKYSIIDLKYTSFFLKRVFKLIQYTIQRNKKILIIGNAEDIQFLINEKLTKNKSNIVLWNQEWINGLITNNQIKSTFNKKEIQLIFIIKNSINDQYLNTELSSLQVPIISFLNTNQTLKNINYPILMNTSNIKSLYALLYLIRKIF